MRALTENGTLRSRSMAPFSRFLQRIRALPPATRKRAAVAISIGGTFLVLIFSLAVELPRHTSDRGTEGSALFAQVSDSVRSASEQISEISKAGREQREALKKTATPTGDQPSSSLVALGGRAIDQAVIAENVRVNLDGALRDDTRKEVAVVLTFTVLQGDQTLTVDPLAAVRLTAGGTTLSPLRFGGETATAFAAPLATGATATASLVFPLFDPNTPFTVTVDPLRRGDTPFRVTFDVLAAAAAPKLPTS